MELPNLYCPADTPKDWIKYHAKLFLRLIDIPFLLPHYVSLPQFYKPVLKNAGFICLGLVKDKEFLTKQALFFDKTLPIYSDMFAQIIENYINTQSEKYVFEKISSNTPILKSIPQIKNRYNENSNVKLQITKKLGKTKGIEIAKNIKSLIVGPCIICLKNNTENLLILNCCGNLAHKSCFGLEAQKKCELCGKNSELIKTIIDIDFVFMSNENYEKKLAELKTKKEKQEKENLERIAKEVTKINEKIFEEEAIRRGFTKK